MELTALCWSREGTKEVDDLETILEWRPDPAVISTLR
jgi:hypothetical protein